MGSRPSEIQMPDRSNLAQDAPSRSDWLGRACQHLASSLGDAGNQHQIQMVVQALPSQSKSTEVQPVFEKVVEAIQNHCTIAPYITITHAVSQVMSMDEVPASPPATPNANNSGDDYFHDQTIFTHAAVVPAYHSQSNPPMTMGSRPTNIIAAPSSIHVSILERYIPPTTAQEVNDFFTLSRRSYLADRLLQQWHLAARLSDQKRRIDLCRPICWSSHRALSSSIHTSQWTVYAGCDDIGSNGCSGGDEEF